MDVTNSVKYRGNTYTRRGTGGEEVHDALS